MTQRLFRAWPIHLLFLALAVATVYYHTLDVPFYLDDFSSIQENSLIYQWQGVAALRDYAPMRVLCYLTFAANYRVGHFDPRGYHLINILIHFLGGVAAYGFARGLLRTPRLVDAVTPRLRAGFPVLVSALFVLHPLQTQAVTYIVQRLASLLALFYIASMASFLQARLSEAAGPRFLWAGACALFAGLALFTKENSATLPLALLLLELTFFRHRRKELLACAGLALGGLGLVWLVTATAFGHTPFSWESMEGVTSQARDISRLTYFATQMPILWHYVRLFYWPTGLHLDYDASLRHLGDPIVLVALGGHVMLVSLGLWAWRRWPLVTFGILFYYLAHGVESSFIPIPELVFEHRAHLPDLGLCLLTAWALVESPRWLGGPRLAVPRAALVLLMLAAMTWRRNQLWRDPIAFWQDNVRLAPTKARAWGELGKSLILAQRPAEGEKALRESLRLQATSTPAGQTNPVDIINLATALHEQGRDSEALTLIQEHIDRPMEPSSRALLTVVRANIQSAQHRFPEAETSYLAALALEPARIDARGNLASIWAQSGRMASAESLFRVVLAIDPGNLLFRENFLQVRALRLFEEGHALARAHHSEQAQQAYRRSLQALEEVLRLNPSNASALANLATFRKLAQEPSKH